MPRARTRRIFPWACSPAQAADALGISYETVRQAIKSGALPCRKIGNKRRVTWRDVNRWILRDWPRVS